MSKELTPMEALKRIKSHYNDRVCIDILEDFDLIEKSLKALEIIKKHVNVYEERFAPFDRPRLWHVYLKMEGYLDDKHEEYDLLKEVLP